MSAPLYGVTIVNVYLPLLTLSLGYVQVQGVWEETGRIRPQSWRRGAAIPRRVWKSESVVPQVWKPERP